MKLKDVLEINNNIKSVVEKRLPVRVGFVLMRNMRSINSVAQDFEEKRMDVVAKYANRDDSGEVIVNEDGGVLITDVQAFNSDLTELLETDVDLNLDVVTLEDLQKCDEDGYDALTPLEISAIEFMLQEE